MASIELYKSKINNMSNYIEQAKTAVSDFCVDLSALKSKILGINSSVCDNIVSSISTSSQTQEQQIAGLEATQKEVNAFIDLTVNRDNSASAEVSKRKNDFYKKYSYLKPECEKSNWEKFCGGLKKVGEWCKEHWKEIVLVIEIVVAVACLFIPGAQGIGTGILIGALKGAITGGLIGGITSLLTGGSFLEGFAQGALDGAIMGGALGGVGGLAGKFITCGSKLGNAIQMTSKVSSVMSNSMDGFDMLSLGLGMIDPNNPLTALNSKLHQSDLYNSFQMGVSLVSSFSGAASESMSCFIAGTMVLTATGLVAIESLATGDKIIASDPDTFEIKEKTILETYVREVNKLVHLVINGEKIVTTDSHPFYVQGRGFVEAGRLLIGDKLISVNGEDLIIDDYVIELTESPVSVFNFQVEDYHTYFVGKCGAWVHNKCKTIKNDDGTYDVEAEYKKGWTEEQKRAADKKCEQLSNADTKIANKAQIDTQRQASTSSNKKFRETNNIPPSQDVDHIQDIQFGGLDTDANKQGLDKSVNRSLGSQFKNGTKELKPGTVLKNFRMVDKIK